MNGEVVQLTGSLECLSREIVRVKRSPDGAIIEVEEFILPEQHEQR